MSVSPHPCSRPGPTVSDAGIVIVTTWRVGTPERQQAAVDAIARTWEARDWPVAGLLSYSVLTGEDGDTLLHYSQWRSEEDYHEMVRTERAARNAEIDAAVPGIDRATFAVYELYRGGARGAEDARVPGGVVIVDVEFDGPGPARQRAWADALSEALGGDREQCPGVLSGHFLVSLDGTRALHYAEWESAHAHRDAEAVPGSGTGADTPWGRRVRPYPGLVSGTVRRYTPALSLSPGVQRPSGP
ncbi:antibiotic biosynthesis monooxygenase [Streptomyces sp. MUM 203J]|uniref:antibiotic biosynthesis monooxygenase n=1 Tax=Streptomyces sp. MUM 203J TaxID=2791990 RepID=UPI001F03B1AC|nr:antibiotic biosynthesis monooxygenase [Streptomyces sp. MUM 203J]MCH0539600.1 antibiotic biosynthesis monooxygenase [Streptomyces sp. MUM 203J]